MISPLVLDAIKFAAKKHTHQKRCDEPYINHPIDVVNILVKYGKVTDTNTLIVAALHDVLEDTNTKEYEIINKYGHDVFKILLEVSDDQSLSSIDKKKKQIENVSKISYEAKLVKLADKYSNIRDLEKNPPKTWKEDEIVGYIMWCYFLCQEIPGTLPILENKLNKIFCRRGIDKMTLEKKREILEKYYGCINGSD